MIVGVVKLRYQHTLVQQLPQTESFDYVLHSVGLRIFNGYFAGQSALYSQWLSG